MLGDRLPWTSFFQPLRAVLLSAAVEQIAIGRLTLAPVMAAIIGLRRGAKILRDNRRWITTSAIWTAMQRPRLTTAAPIYINFCPRLVSNQSLIDFGVTRVCRKLPDDFLGRGV